MDFSAVSKKLRDMANRFRTGWTWIMVGDRRVGWVSSPATVHWLGKPHRVLGWESDWLGSTGNGCVWAQSTLLASRNYLDGLGDSPNTLFPYLLADIYHWP